MDIHKTFHMKGGLGDTSYSKNSSLQKSVADTVKHITLETIQQLINEIRPKSIGIADLGCSSGPNTLSNLKQLIWAVENASGQMAPPAECRVYLNDLPTNDFNTVFQALPGLYRELGDTLPVYVAACPGTFYSRIFPDDCLHFVYSANSLHWLSKVPPGIYDEKGVSMNKKSLYISERSPPAVAEAYSEQFRRDLWQFLRSRSPEVVRGGRMVLLMVGRRVSDQHADDGDFNSLLWDLLYQSLTHLALQGEIEEEMLESYDVHFYAPSKEELENEIRKEGSFKVETMKMVETDGIGNNDNGSSYGMVVAKTVRSIQESMLLHHFHLGEEALHALFLHFGTLIDQRLRDQFRHHRFKNISMLAVLSRH